jgi:nucleoside-diphosphate-sugar epimerase
VFEEGELSLRVARIAAAQRRSIAVRISAGELKRARAERSGRIMLTGGTGFLGSHLAAELLRSGNRIFLLARPLNRQRADERVARLLDWFGIEPGLRANLRIVEGTIEKPGLGLDTDVLPDCLENTTEVIHCASNTGFAERKRPEVEAANIGGLLNVLDFAASSSCGFFHHLSTAYVAGKREGPCREEIVDAGDFTNVYEETKALGERLVSDGCRAAGIRLNIYRPSIVYGDSRTGRSLLFNALYYPVKTVVFLKDLYEADILKRGGRKAAMMGVRRESDGSLYLPIRLEVESAEGINLVPIDHFIAAFAAIREDSLDGGIFHIVNAGLTTMEKLIDYTQRLFHIRGIEPCRPEDFGARPRNAIETLFTNYLEAYGPYMRDKRTFAMDNARGILAARGIVCPEFDFEIFGRCMKYAVQVDWGGKLFGGA